ncbi:MAG: sulfatase-like hydrolase/transferase, partial [Anaerolineales bacterium]|nr:sulfatase-like hydrolase/transferase [Anaerolineales bacterium]
MTKISRRDFLMLLATAPFYKVAWSQAASSIDRLKQQTENSDTPNILFIVFDTLSAQHVSLFGYQRETTPNFARFAERATVFHNHRTTANFTSPATSSIFTGTYPWTHRAFHLHGTIDHTFAERNMFNLLPDSYYKAAYTHNLLVTSLLHQFGGELDMFKQTRDLCLTDGEFADLLFNNDYSAAFWGESTALRTGATPPGTIFLSMLERMRRFATKSAIDEQYAALYPRGIPNLHNLFFLLEDAIDWIGEQVTTLPQPFLGYFHLLPPHEPYTT